MRRDNRIAIAVGGILAIAVLPYIAPMGTSPDLAYASGEPSITIGSPLQASESTVSIPVTVNNIPSGSYQAFVSVPEGAGTLSITSDEVTALFGYHSTSFTRSSDRELGFAGSLSQVQGALDTLIFTPASGTPETELTVSVTQAPSGSNAQNIYYFPDNGHYYEFVNQEDSIRWDDARDGASQKSLFGMDGYLVTITSLPEQDFVRNQIDAPNIWIGATDRFDLINAARGDSFFSGQRTGNQPSEGKWHWVTGPEAGTQFWEPGTSGEFDTQRRGLGGQSVDSEFSAWCSEEPNDHNQREHYAAANFNCRVDPTSFEYNWNDFSIEQEPTSYLVEYGGVDGEVSTAISTATTQWVVPEAPTGVTGVTGDGEFTFSWSAASDSADFVTNFEYRLDAGSWVSLGSTATEVTVAVDDVCEALVFEVRAVIGSQSGPESDDFTVSGCNTITVVDSGGAAEGSGWNFSGGVFKAIQDVSINAGVVESELAEGSVVIDAQNITVDGGIEFRGDNSLTLRAAESVELRANIDSDGPITIYSDAISVQAALAATNDTITFQGAGSNDSKGTLSNTSDGTITADNLLIRNIHNASLHSHENVSVNTVASTGGYRLLLANDQALEVGTVSGVNGVSATEWVAIDTTTGDLSITQPVGTTLTTSSWGLRLRAGTDTAFGTASGGDVTVSGSGAINVPNAQTQVFSGSAAGSTGLSALSTTEVVSEVAPTVAAGEVGVAYRAGPPAFSSATTMRFDDELTLLATDPAGSSVTYSKVSGDCSLDGSTVEPTGVGDCVMRATASGSGLTTDTTISISKAPQSIAFTSSVPTSAVSGTRYTPSATATSGLTVEFAITSGSPSVCTLAGGVVEFQSAGSCTIEASIADGQSGAANYLAATAVSQTIVAGKINQTISFSVIADRNYGDPSFAAGATVSSGRTVTYSSPGSSSSVCRVNSSTGVVVILDVGDCTVTASSAGDSSYASAADVTRTFTVRAVVPGKASLTSASFGDQRITVGFVAPESNGGAAITGYRALATPAGGGSAIQQTCGSVSPCTVSGLTNGTGYTVTLAAINSAGAASASDASPAVTPATAPDSVSNLRTSPGNEQLVVAWTRAENFGGGTFTAYEVYLRESGQSWPGSATQTMSSESDETVTLTGLTNGTAYDVKVVTVSSANQTEIAGTNLAVAFGVPVTVADAPTGLSVTALSSTTALASWKAPADNGGTVITAYSVSPGCDFDTATDAYCTLTGLTPSSSVTVSVGATNFVGTGATTQAVVAMPAAPRNDSGNNDSDDSDDSPAQVVAPPMSPSAVPTADQPRRLPVGPGPAVRPDVVTGPVQLPGGPSGTLANPRGFVGGIPAPVRTTPSADGGFDVSASTLRLDLRPGATPGGSASVPGENALPAVTPGDSAGASSESMRLLVPQGGSTAFRGGGLLPGSSLQVFLPGSSGGGGGAELARIPVNTSGEFDGEVGFGRNLDQMPLPIGEQVLQAVGYDENGNQVVVELPVNIAQGAPTPEWDREAGAVPELTAGQVLATSAGLPESVTITALPEIGQVNAVAGDWSFSIRVAEDAGSVEQAGSSANVRLIRDRAAEASGSGFQPGTRVDMWLFSEPTLLGSVTVGDDGEFVGEFFLDPRFATVGEHTLQLQGVGTDGFVKAVNMGVTVDDAVGATSTGANTLLWWALGVFLAIVIALVLFALLSRRSQQA